MRRRKKNYGVEWYTEKDPSEYIKAGNWLYNQVYLKNKDRIDAAYSGRGVAPYEVLKKRIEPLLKQGYSIEEAAAKLRRSAVFTTKAELLKSNALKFLDNDPNAKKAFRKALGNRPIDPEMLKYNAEDKQYEYYVYGKDKINPLKVITIKFDKYPANQTIVGAYIGKLRINPKTGEILENYRELVEVASPLERQLASMDKKAQHAEYMRQWRAKRREERERAVRLAEMDEFLEAWGEPKDRPPLPTGDNLAEKQFGATVRKGIKKRKKR